jgi:hypothetical protein
MKGKAKVPTINHTSLATKNELTKKPLNKFHKTYGEQQIYFPPQNGKKSNQ